MWRWRIWVTIGWGCRLGRELERGRHIWVIRVADVNALSGAEFIEVIDVEALKLALKQGLTLLQLTFEALSITPRSESLPVPVLLMTRSASIGACCASRVLAIALLIIKRGH